MYSSSTAFGKVSYNYSTNVLPNLLEIGSIFSQTRRSSQVVKTSAIQSKLSLLNWLFICLDCLAVWLWFYGLKVARNALNFSYIIQLIFIQFFTWLKLRNASELRLLLAFFLEFCQTTAKDMPVALKARQGWGLQLWLSLGLAWPAHYFTLFFTLAFLALSHTHALPDRCQTIVCVCVPHVAATTSLHA